MAEILMTTVVSSDIIKKVEEMFEEERKQKGVANAVTTKFQYAYVLIRSSFSADIQKGIVLLENLLQKPTNNESIKRDYLYYLAVGNARVKDYGTALRYLEGLTKMEVAENLEAVILRKVIKKLVQSEIITERKFPHSQNEV